MQVYVFLDLDDTVFQTRRKCSGASSLRVAACARDGAPLSFTTEKQRAFLGWLGRDARLVPTTARNYDAFRRVALSFNGMAILDFGGVVLDQSGQLDRQWDHKIREQVVAAREPLHRVHDALLDTAEQEHLRIRSRIITDFEMDLYVVAKQRQVEGDDLRQLYDLSARRFANDLFYVHFNDNNLAVIPRCLNKRHAVQYLIDTRLQAGEDVLSIGIGDSTSDLDFMSACDYCLTPRNSQIARALMEARGV